MGDGIKLTLVLLTSRCSGWFTPATVAFDISIVTRSQVLIQLYFSNFKLYSELYFESVRFFIIKYTVRHCYLVLVLVCVLLFVWDCTHAPFCSHVYLIVSEVVQILMAFGRRYTKQLNMKSISEIPSIDDSTTQIDLCPLTDLNICHQLCRLNVTRLPNPPPEGSISADSGQMEGVQCYGMEVTRFCINSAWQRCIGSLLVLLSHRGNATGQQFCRL